MGVLDARVEVTRNTDERDSTLAVLTRWGGLAGMFGGVLFAVWGYVHRDGAPSYFVATADTLAFVVPLLFLAALMGLYVPSRVATGWLGGAGFVFGSIGCARGVIDGATGEPSQYLYVAGYGWAAPLLDWLSLLVIGLTLLGAAAIWEAGPGIWCPLPLVISLFGWAYNLTDFGSLFEARFAHVVSGLLFSAGWMVLGFLLWSQNRTSGSVSKYE